MSDSIQNRYNRACSSFNAIWTRKQQGLPYDRRQYSRAMRRAHGLLREMGAVD